MYLEEISGIGFAFVTSSLYLNNLDTHDFLNLKIILIGIVLKNLIQMNIQLIITISKYGYSNW